MNNKFILHTCLPTWSISSTVKSYVENSNYYKKLLLKRRTIYEIAVDLAVLTWSKRIIQILHKLYKNFLSSIQRFINYYKVNIIIALSIKIETFYFFFKLYNSKTKHWNLEERIWYCFFILHSFFFIVLVFFIKYFSIITAKSLPFVSLEE